MRSASVMVNLLFVRSLARTDVPIQGTATASMESTKPLEMSQNAHTTMSSLAATSNEDMRISDGHDSLWKG